MALIFIVSYFISYFNVFMKLFEILSESVFYPGNLFKDILSSFTMFLLLQLFFIFYGILYVFNIRIRSYLCVDMPKEIHTVEKPLCNNLHDTNNKLFACSECRYNCSSQYYLRRQKCLDSSQKISHKVKIFHY